jgi:hypothetical protein
MSERDKDEARALEAQLAQLQPPEWIAEMQRYHRQNGAYRVEDVVRLLGRGSRAGGSLGQTPQEETIELLQQLAGKRK